MIHVAHFASYIIFVLAIHESVHRTGALVTYVNERLPFCDLAKQ